MRPFTVTLACGMIKRINAVSLSHARQIAHDTWGKLNVTAIQEGAVVRKVKL